MGKDQEKVEAEVKRLGLQKVVIFTGFRQDVPDILSASDVSVMASHYEGIPRALMKSMALGIPVVATNVPGTRTLIQSGQTGLLVESENVVELSNALAKVLTDHEMARKLGEKGKNLVQAKFDEYAVADRVEEIYNHVLAKKKYAQLPHWELDLG